MNEMKPIANRSVKICDEFWDRALLLVRNEVIPYQWNALNDQVLGAEPSHCIQNFEIAAGRRSGEFHGFVFQDSDAYKYLESVAYMLETTPDAEVEAQADTLIDLLEEAQEEDGYLNTYFQIKEVNGRWGNLHQAHELYCAGHLIEAAVAYYNATGKRKLLDIAIRFVELIDRLFGSEEGKCKGYPGHQEIELALIRLWGVTKENRYLELARHFIRIRGGKPNYFDTEKDLPNHYAVWPEKFPIDGRYNQSHEPPVEQLTAVGHAVRAVYMYSAMADLALIDNDEALREACKTLYENIVTKQMYITGAIGATVHGEAFSGDYDLPNDSAYAETCASIGLMMFCQRMHTLERDGKYMDTLERALYNTVLSGMSITGQEFFYVNPLEVHPASCECNPGLHHVKTTRRQWFACACCPPNVSRTFMLLGQYAYSVTEDELYVNLYVSSETTVSMKGTDARISVETKYPIQGFADIKVSGHFTLYLRSPSDAPITNIMLNGRPYETKVKKGYISLDILGDAEIEVLFDVTPKLVYTHPKAYHTMGKTAVRVGPIVYCAEQIDNDYAVGSYLLSPDAVFEQEIAVGLAEGVPTLVTDAYCWVADESHLYATTPPRIEKSKLTLVPYHLWGNRGEGEMTVYLNILMK